MFNLEVNGLVHPINGWLFDLNRIDAFIPLGEHEVWVYRHHSDALHPMDPHGVLFQVLGRHGMAILPPGDTGWKNTVLVHPQETVTILVRYQQYQGIYLHHCHNHGHEDDGMRQNVEVRQMHR